MKLLFLIKHKVLKTSMYNINKNKLLLRLIFVMTEFEDDIWSFSANILKFLGKNCKLQIVNQRKEGEFNEE